MRDFMDWFIYFVQQMMQMFFSFAFESSDGFIFGYMMLGVAVIGAVVSATVGAVAIVSNAISRGGRD